jgi:hypothetical protein
MKNMEANGLSDEDTGELMFVAQRAYEFVTGQTYTGQGLTAQPHCVTLIPSLTGNAESFLNADVLEFLRRHYPHVECSVYYSSVGFSNTEAGMEFRFHPLYMQSKTKFLWLTRLNKTAHVLHSLSVILAFAVVVLVLLQHAMKPAITSASVP